MPPKQVVILDEIALEFLQRVLNRGDYKGHEVPAYTWTVSQLKNSIPLNRQSLEGIVDMLKKSVGENTDEQTQ